MPSSFELTDSEYSIVSNAELMHTKNIILKKVISLFAALSQQYVHEAQAVLPPAFTTIPPKISRGDQYLGLPYVMLDYPRLFSRENTFAIRTFFWWGNFFSIHLQLCGNYQQQFAPAIARGLANGEIDHWFVGVGDDEWVHHFETDNYHQLNHVDYRKVLHTHPFFKLAKKIPLYQWEKVESILMQNFKLLLSYTGF